MKPANVTLTTNSLADEKQDKTEVIASQLSLPRTQYSLDKQGAVQVVKNQDQVIIEQPLQIILHYYCVKKANYLVKDFMLTMRTPGHDAFLVTGLLLSQGVINQASDIKGIEENEPNQIEITLTKATQPNWAQLSQYFVSHSGCGVCGQTNIKALALRVNSKIDNAANWLALSQLLKLPEQMQQQQALFSLTGGVHGAGIFANNQWLGVYEDVGRHNAVDKVIGALLTHQQTISQSVLVLSGRISFELVQKAIVANIPVIVAIGAPSDLAIAAAKQFNITLIGFSQQSRCNVYHGEFRINTQG